MNPVRKTTYFGYRFVLARPDRRAEGARDPIAVSYVRSLDGSTVEIGAGAQPRADSIYARMVEAPYLLVLNATTEADRADCTVRVYRIDYVSMEHLPLHVDVRESVAVDRAVLRGAKVSIVGEYDRESIKGTEYESSAAPLFRYIAQPPKEGDDAL